MNKTSPKRLTKLIWVCFCLVWMATSDISNGQFVTILPSSNGVQIKSKRAESLELIYGDGTTTFNLHFWDRKAPDQKKVYSIGNVNGLWFYLSGTKNTLSCSLVKILSTNVYDLLKFNSEDQSFSLLNLNEFLIQLFSSFSLPQIQANIQLAENCIGGFFASTLFRINGTNVTKTAVNSSRINIISESLNYAIFGNQLFRYSMVNAKFESLKMLQAYNSYQLRNYQNRLLIIGQNLTINSRFPIFTLNASLIIYVILDSKNGLFVIGNEKVQISNVILNLMPIQSSPKLTRFVYGYSSVSNKMEHLIFRTIDYESHTMGALQFVDTMTIQYISNNLMNAQYYEVFIGDTFMIFRNTSTQAFSNDSCYETFYQIISNTIVSMGKRLLNTTKELSYWNYGFIDPSFTNQLVYLALYNATDGLQLNQFRFRNYLYFHPYNCSPRCQTCTNFTCSICTQGFIISSSSNTCIACGSNCITCINDNPNNCTACRNSAYLSGTTCLPCDSICLSCSNNPTNCSICPPTQFPKENKCQECSQFCLECTSSGCIQCIAGFALSSTAICKKCMGQCFSCDPNNITKCIRCENGLELLNNTCVRCPSKCALCQNGSCLSCILGFNLVNRNCIITCDSTCSSCFEEQSKQCLSCNYNNWLNGTTCQADLICNTDKSCTACGMRYYLVVNQCFACQNQQNCIYCDPLNSVNCLTCEDRYFLEQSNCSICQSPCLTCVGLNICTSCISGYYIPTLTVESRCLICKSPCKTCTGSNNFCNSCIDGYKLKKFRCQNNIYIDYKVVFSSNSTVFLNNKDAFIKFVLNVIGETDNLDALNINQIASGSTTVSGEVTLTNSSNTSAAIISLRNAFSSGLIIDGLTVFSTDFQSNSSDTTSTPSTTDSNINLGLILGLALGVPLTIIIGIIILVLIRKFQSKKYISGEYINKELKDVDFSSDKPQDRNQFEGLQMQKQTDIKVQHGIHTKVKPGVGDIEEDQHNLPEDSNKKQAKIYPILKKIQDIILSDEITAQINNPYMSYVKKQKIKQENSHISQKSKSHSETGTGLKKNIGNEINF